MFPEHSFPRRRFLDDDCSLEFFIHRVTRVFQHLEGPDLLECKESFFNYTLDHSVGPTVRSSWTDCGGRPPPTDDFGSPPSRREKMDDIFGGSPATPIVPTPSTGVGSLSTGLSGSAAAGGGGLPGSSTAPDPNPVPGSVVSAGRGLINNPLGLYEFPGPPEKGGGGQHG